MEAVIQDLKRLQYVSPVLSLIVQSLVQHIHDFIEFVRSVDHMSDLSSL